MKKWFTNSFRHKRALDVVSTLEPKSILELGCDKGQFTEMLGSMFPRASILAFDINEKSIRRAKEESKHSNIKYCADDAWNVGGKFDLIVMTEFLEHINNPERMLKKTSNMGKYLFISVPREPWFKAAAWLVRGNSLHEHINYWTPKQFKELCKGYGAILRYKKSAFWQMALLEVKKNDE